MRNEFPHKSRYEVADYLETLAAPQSYTIGYMQNAIESAVTALQFGNDAGALATLLRAKIISNGFDTYQERKVAKALGISTDELQLRARRQNA